MLRKFWLLFAQACTLCLAALFVVATLRPDLLAQATRRDGVVLLQETSTPVTTPTIASHADAAKKAMPAVVNVYTSKEMRQKSPLVDDALLRRYFPDLADRAAAPARHEPGLRRDRRRPRAMCSPTIT